MSKTKEKLGLEALHHLRIIVQKELCLLVPYTPQHILRLEKAGKFPRRIRLGANRVGWLLVDVEAWIASRRMDGHSRDHDQAAV